MDLTLLPALPGPAVHAAHAAGDSPEHFAVAEQFEHAAELFSGSPLDALPTIATRDRSSRSSLHLFENDLYRSRQHMAWLRQCKREKAAVRSHGELKRKTLLVGKAWDDQRHRYGDRVDIDEQHNNGAATRDHRHPNQWTHAGVIRAAFMQIGHVKTLRCGVDAVDKELGCLSATSSVAQVMQQSWLDDRKELLIAQRQPAAFYLFYDATPRSMMFGRLQESLAPSARYPWFDKATKKWTMIKYDDMQLRTHGRKCLQRGVLDVLGTSVEVRSLTHDGLLDGFSSLGPPQVIQNGSASCIHAALNMPGAMGSLDNIKEIALALPFVWCAETPDACRANLRHQGKASKKLQSSPNVFHVKGRCGAHQCERIIATTEGKSVGDLHAVAVACGAPSHSVALLGALEKLVEEPMIFPGPPPVEFTMRNRDVAKRTLLRKSELISSDTFMDCSPLDLQAAYEDAVDRFLAVFNGDWRSRRPQHYCDGCHGSPEEVSSHMAASANDVDLMCCRCKEPSLDDWGSAGIVSGKAGAGILVHELLPQAYANALPSWSSMIPPSQQNVEDAPGIEQQRARIQKKSWRAHLVLESWPKQRSILLLCWCTPPIERLQSELAWLDSRSNGLFDVIFNDNLNPVHKAQQAVQELQQQGSSGGLKYLLDAVDPSLRADLLEESGGLLSSFGAQLDWRFNPLKCFPYKWATWVHPGATAETKDDVVTEFFEEMKPCCRRRECDGKIYDYFGGSADNLKSCQPFEDSVKVWVSGSKYTNMAMERLLGDFRRANPTDHGDAERLVSAGFLSQIMKVHRSHGFDDPRATSRQQLLLDGVPLKCAKKLKASKPASPWVHWIRGEEERRKDAGMRLDKKEYVAWRRDKVAEWHRMGEASKRVQRDAAVLDFYKKHIASSDGLPDPVQHKPLLDTFLDATGDRKTPLTESAFSAVVRRELGLDESQQEPGFTAYVETLRQKQLDTCFIKDRNDIAPSEVFTEALPCPIAHPGLCVQRDAWCMSQARDCAKSVYEYLLPFEANSWWCFRIVHEGGGVKQLFAKFCHERNGGPALDIFCVAHAIEHNSFEMGTQHGKHFYMIGITLVGKMFQMCGRDDPLSELYICPAPRHPTKIIESTAVFHMPFDWEDIVVQSQKRVFPRTVHHHNADSEALREAMRKLKVGFKSLELKQLKATRKRDTSPGVRLLMPKAVGDSHADSDKCSSGSELGSADGPESSDADTCSEGLPGGGGDAGGPPGPPAPGPRHMRAKPFGRWLISPIFSKGTCVGWGAQCNGHYDADSKLPCRKFITAGKLNTPTYETSASPPWRAPPLGKVTSVS